MPWQRHTQAAARWISIVEHPFVLGGLLLFFATRSQQGASGGLRSTLAVLGLVVLPLGLFMFWRLRAGHWTNIDASRPRERPALYGISLLLLAALLVVARLRPEMGYLSRTTLGLIALFSTGLLLNRWVKASLHVAFCAFLGMIAVRILPPLGIAYLSSLPVLAWARVRMQRHTPVEVVVGACLGLVLGALVAFR